MRKKGMHADAVIFIACMAVCFSLAAVLAVRAWA